MAVSNLFSSKGKDLDRTFEELKKTYLELDRDSKEELYQEFLDRYQFTLKNKLDLKKFFAKEKGDAASLRSMVARQRDEKEKKRASMAEGSSTSALDTMIERQLTKIREYPSLSLPHGVPEEVSHLYGAIKQLADTQWPMVQQILRSALGARDLFILSELERKLFLVTSHDDTIPFQLKSYAEYFETPGVSKAKLTAETQDALKSAAFFLADLHRAIKNAIANGSADGNSTYILHHLDQLFDDFQLAHFKKQEK